MGGQSNLTPAKGWQNWLLPLLGLSIVIAVSFFSAFNMADAQTGASCDSRVSVKSCRATVTPVGNVVVIRSDTPNCSIVEWTIDGIGRQSTVLDGEELLEILTSSKSDFQVQSCVEVKDLRRINESESANKPRNFTSRCTCMRMKDEKGATVAPEMPGGSATAFGNSFEEVRGELTRICQQNCKVAQGL